MPKLAATGIALMVMGAMLVAEHANRAPTFEDYLAFRCGPQAAAMAPGAAMHSFLQDLHCWGCPVMAIGAGLLAAAVIQALKPAGRLAASSARTG